MIRRPPRSTLSSSSAASDVYKRQGYRRPTRCGDPLRDLPMWWRSGSGWVQAGQVASKRRRRQVASTRQRRGSEGGSDEPVGRGGRAQRRTASVAPAGAAGRVGSRLRLARAAAGAAARAPPTVDGPAHPGPGQVLTNWRLPIYRHYYAIDLFPSPNLLAGLLLAGLLGVAEPAWADKLLAAGYLVLFPLALRYAVAGVNRSARWLAFLAFPLSCGYLFWYGFANYGYGVAGALFAVGFALRHGPNWTPRSTLGLGALLLLCYATHLVPFALAVIFVTVTGVVSAAVGQRAGDPHWRRD